MASFSFGAGNAAKLARIPLYAVGRLITLFVRRRSRWVFGCGAGIGDGALALWDVVRDEGHDAIWLIGSEREARDAAQHGIPTLRRHSLRGFWATARAGVIVVTHGFGDVNPYGVSGGFVAQLWHGIPLKRIGLDSPETVRSALLPNSRIVRRLLAALYRGAARRIDVLPAASHRVRGRLESAFGLPDDRVVVTGEPRVDVLSAGTAQERRRVGRELLASAAGPFTPETQLVLYAPTWRDGESDPAVPDAAQWSMLVDALESADAVLLVRSHRLGEGDYTPPFETSRVRPVTADVLPDVTPALPGVDVLITDYSSLAFDAGLVPLPVLFLAPDVAEYAARRGFYGAYRDVAGDDYSTDWTTLAGQLLEGPTERAVRTERSRRLSDGVHAFRDGGNARRVHHAIVSRIATKGIA